MRSEGLPQHERHQEIRAPEREDGGSRGEELSRKEFTEMSLDCVPDRWRKAPTLTHTVVISEAKAYTFRRAKGGGTGHTGEESENLLTTTVKLKCTRVILYKFWHWGKKIMSNL